MNPLNAVCLFVCAAHMCAAHTCVAQVKEAAQPDASRPHATSQQTPAGKVPSVSETVTVVGQLDPVTEGESQRSTAPLEVQPQRLTVSGPAELLRDDTSVDVQQRGGGGVQNDVSIRGSSYEQTLVLLNGLRVNDAETSHFNLDLPVPFDALEGLYVLHGAGSTLYGSDAVSGVVNVVTRTPAEGWEARLRTGAASFDGNTEAALLSGSGKHASEVLAAEREFSSGFIGDRDFRSEEVSSETRAHSPLGLSDVLMAASDRKFGAAEFYGDYPSWEHTKGWFAALTQQMDRRTQLDLAYRRHTDEFVLFRNQPAIYENNHIDSSWQGVVRRQDDLPGRTRIDYGLDINADQINSTNLGRHGRNRGAGYASALFHLGAHGTATAGMREEIFSGGTAVAVPAFALSEYVHQGVKLRGAVTRGFRLPTYNDLYYSDPANRGNPNLRPESSWSYEGGVDWYASARWAVSATGYTSRQSNVIDYVRADASQAWQAENVTRVTLSGAEIALDWRPREGQQVRLALTTVAGAGAASPGEQSKYAFSFPSENALAEWNAHWRPGLALRERLRIVHRVTGELYPVLDSSLAFERGWIHPYLQVMNLTNTSYQEVIGVPMPPRALAGGVELRWKSR